MEIELRKTYRGISYSAGVDPIAVNTDTGAVYGHRLSAVGFDEKWSLDGRIHVIQVAVGRGYRRSYELTRSTIYFGA